MSKPLTNSLFAAPSLGAVFFIKNVDLYDLRMELYDLRMLFHKKAVPLRVHLNRK